MSEPVLVALIVAVIGPAAVALIQQHRSNSRLADRIGDPNGHKNLVEMAEKILAGQAGQDNRLAALEGRASHIEEDVAGLKARTTVLESAFDLAHKEGP